MYIMLIALAAKFLHRRGPRILNLVTHNLRKSSNQKDPCCQPATSPSSACPDPPPCPPMPHCPPAMCHPVPDPNNPCNYCPPPCIDPDAADVTKIKRKQCHFQTNTHIPIYLRNGNFDAFIYQLTLVSVVVLNVVGLYYVGKLM